MNCHLLRTVQKYDHLYQCFTALFIIKDLCAPPSLRSFLEMRKCTFSVKQEPRGIFYTRIVNLKIDHVFSLVCFHHISLSRHLFAVSSW